MKVTVLIENTKKNNDLFSEHGLSLLIETLDKKILFDTGQSNKFFLNAQKLNLDLTEVDYAILSHGHYDHGGGLEEFIKINNKAPIYLNEHVLEDHYHFDRYIGLNNFNSDQFVYLKDSFKINERIYIFNNQNNKLKYPIQSNDFYKKQNNVLIPEDFNHEQFLVINENNKSIVFSGCSHKGILNIVDYFKPDIFFGGFHLHDIKLNSIGVDELNKIADKLNSYNCQYYTFHCTGTKQYQFLKEKLGSKINYLSTGMSIVI